MGSQPLPTDSGSRNQGYVSRALNEWLEALTGPQSPSFSPGAVFPDAEWAHFFRMFAVSTTLAATVVAVNKFVPNLASPLMPTMGSLKAITVFALIGVFYSHYAKIFGITIGTRQALFSFALILVPWFPLYMVVKACGKYLGVLWFFAMAGMAIYVAYLLGKAIHIVANAAWIRVILSFIIAALLAVVAVGSRVGHK
jgi:hypothetical protein